jgi:hypothetical protein
MRTYAEFRPTAFDCAGLALEDRQGWLVAPCGHNRDSTLLAESNWAAQEKALPEGDDVEVHRFGHWANGWFELTIVRPGSAAAKEAVEIESALANYPVLSDEDYSAREFEATLSNVEQVIGDVVRRHDGYDNVDPANTAGAVERWLSENEPEEVESRNDQGGYPSEEAVARAIDALAEEVKDA